MNTKEWFADWFDTTYYHTLYKDRNDDEATEFIANLLAFIKLESNSRVLDLACGKGRHSLTLNKHGHNVLGVDLSLNSISCAQKNANKTLNFSVHDMRQTIVNDEFDAVFNLFTSFGYFDNISDNHLVIRSIHTMLKKEGYLIIDFMNAAKVIDHLVEKETKEIDGITFQLERSYDGVHIKKDIRFEDKDMNFHFTERVQALKEEDFIKLLEENKFKIISTFGDFSLNTFSEATSDRLILIAKKI